MSALRLWLLIVITVSACEQEQRDDAPIKVQEQRAIALTQPLQSAQDAQRNVIYKRPRVLINSLAKILVLDENGMCMELGELPCRLIHSVSLGGVSAYDHSQYHVRDSLPVTAPTSLERIVLSACMQRASLDFVNPANAVIYQDIELSIDGRLTDNDKVDSAIKRLYRRALMRDPSMEEVTSFKALYREIYDEQPRGAALNWMTLSCFAVLSSLEGVFY